MVFKYLTRQAPMLTQNGHTALMLAASGGHTSVVTLLLDAKADVDLVDQAS